MTENVEALLAEWNNYSPFGGGRSVKAIGNELAAALAERTTKHGCLDTKCPATALVGIHTHPAERTTTAAEHDREAVADLLTAVLTWGADDEGHLPRGLADVLAPFMTESKVAPVSSREQVEAAAKAGHEHVRSQRPESHGPFDSWDELDESYREYLRGIAQAHLAALPPARDAAEHIERLRVAMLGTTDGDYIETDDEVPAGEMFRLAAKYIESAFLPPAAPTVTAKQIAEAVVNYGYDRAFTFHGQCIDLEDLKTMGYEVAAAVLALLQQGAEAND